MAEISDMVKKPIGQAYYGPKTNRSGLRRRIIRTCCSIKTMSRVSCRVGVTHVETFIQLEVVHAFSL